MSGRKRRLRNEWILPALLFCMAFITVTFAGIVYLLGGIPDVAELLKIADSNPKLLLQSSLQFASPLLAILLVHEMGHFLACRHYGIRCTPPFFIPAPIPFTGTFGAFIRIKSPFPNKKILFDVGFAGPLAGFVAAMVVLWIGIGSSRVVMQMPVHHAGLNFGEPLVFRLIGMLRLGYESSRDTMFVHPTAIAGLWGLLVTSLNLLPVWQLDGGHISYAVFGPRIQKRLSMVILIILAGSVLFSAPSYLVFCILLFILGYRFKFDHPATLRDHESLGYARTTLAILACIILVLCFTPVPIWFT